MRAGSMPRRDAFARVQRMAAFTSSICAGQRAAPLAARRYCAAMFTYPRPLIVCSRAARPFLLPPVNPPPWKWTIAIRLVAEPVGL